MSLKQGSIFESTTAGAVETITLSPNPPNTTTLAMFASAFYGTDVNGPVPAVISASGKSVTITVLSGWNSLVMTLVSPNNQPETVVIGQGSLEFATPTIISHTAVSTVFIKGV